MADKRESEIHKRQILNAATALLSEHGAEGLRVRDIAAASDCSTMGVYSHFGGKNGLVEAIFIDGFERFHDALRSKMGGPEKTRMRRVARAYRNWALVNKGSYEVMFAGAVPGFEPSDEAMATALRSFQIMIEVVEAEQAAGRIGNADTHHVAHTLWALVHGMVMIELAGMAPQEQSGKQGDRFFDDAVAAGARGFA